MAIILGQVDLICNSSAVSNSKVIYQTSASLNSTSSVNASGGRILYSSISLACNNVFSPAGMVSRGTTVSIICESNQNSIAVATRGATFDAQNYGNFLATPSLRVHVPADLSGVTNLIAYPTKLKSGVLNIICGSSLSSDITKQHKTQAVLNSNSSILATANCIFVSHFSATCTPSIHLNGGKLVTEAANPSLSCRFRIKKWFCGTVYFEIGQTVTHPALNPISQKIVNVYTGCPEIYYVMDTGRKISQSQMINLLGNPKYSSEELSGLRRRWGQSLNKIGQ